MVYCVVYNCSTSSNVDKNVSFFGFPKDNTRQKLWIHYCRRRDFVVTKHSKICSKHFSPSQYSRHPSRLAALGYQNARAQLKQDAAPDVPWVTKNKSTRIKNKKKSALCGAYRKRRKLEVLEEVMKGEENADEDGALESDNSIDLSTPVTDSCHSESNTKDKAMQISSPDTKVITRTRRIQTGKSFIHFYTTDSQVQCDSSLLCHKCQNNLEFEGVQFEKNKEFKESLEFVKNEEIQENEDFNSNDDDEGHPIINREEDPDFSLSDYEELSEFEEDPDFSLSDYEEESEEEATCNYRLQTTDNPSEEKYYMISESSLHKLLSVCQICCGGCIPSIVYNKGSMISTVSKCENGHTNKWQSQAVP